MSIHLVEQTIAAHQTGSEPIPRSALAEAPPIGVAVIGCGYWGPNLIRNFATCPATRVEMICDQDPGRLTKARALSPQAQPTTEFREVLADPRVEAVAIATPPATHARLAAAALEAGKHVVVEKPLAMTERDAERLVELAERHHRTLMVDHTFIYSEPVRKIKQLLDAGELGEIYYIDSVRINLGLFQHDANVLWDLAPHDLSIVDYLLGRMPRSLAATGTCHTGNDIEDVAYLNLDFGKNLIASFHINWLSPVKVRHLIIGGSKKSIVYNDLDLAEPIKVYDRGFTIAATPEARHGALISYRTGDIWSPHVERTEPLQNMVAHFAACIREGKRPITDGEAGLRIVRILDAAQRSIKAQGGRITL
ncbi:MAG TPA: Gfo/Idh/MocA family oxidoreductase [Gemmataceae bacterium]|nr:Gfo/Idh/MocA family oxidoreductase [Gemmataceae bacterium]